MTRAEPLGRKDPSTAVKAGVMTTQAGLLPDRHPTCDFFVCDIFDAAPKGDLATMEHPVFSLSTRPDLPGQIYGF